MNYPTHDTEWATSSKGNTWRRKNGKALIVGLNKKTNKYWARRGDDFVKGSFNTKREAMIAAEFDVAGDINNSRSEEDFTGGNA